MLYCIDSHTFVWAVKEQAEAEDQYRLEEAKKLMKWIDDSKHQLIVPTIVLAECLIREPQENHAAIIGAAYRRFIVADFDARCALRYGEMLRLEKWQDAKDLAKENNIRREKMKIDHMIVACAIVNNANGIFSEDDDIIKFANGNIRVHSLKEIAEQGELFIL